jgi:hypothetical protein
MTTPALAADARNRALRTFLQGLVADVAAAVVLLVLPVVTNAQGWEDFDWRILGFLLAKTVVVTGLSYLMRTVLDRSSIPTPLPPSDRGQVSWWGVVVIALLVFIVLILAGVVRIG